MDNYSGEDYLDEKTIKMVLQEYGEQQQELINAIQQQQTSIDTLIHRQAKLEQKWTATDQKLADDRGAYKVTLKGGIDAIHETIRQQPKAVVRQFRVQLFPEYNAGEYYRIVFSRVIGWLVLVTVATYLFSLGKQYIDRSQSVREKELETNQYRKAWNYLYERESKTARRKMDSAWQKSWLLPE
jgi:hypothetical protein